MAVPLVMLTRPGDFATLQRDGTSRANQFLAVRAVRNGLGGTRFAFSTGHKLGGAVVRNRVRRRLRAIVRGLVPRLEQGWDVLVVARSGAVEATYAQLATAVEWLFRRVGLLRSLAPAR